ncbi:MAG: protein phosphatase 2C domain-containing protein, partial [Clostridia bacterium]|nr:protein phosphatase 2C domain-containing protein [Clostridia bacterium]
NKRSKTVFGKLDTIYCVEKEVKPDNGEDSFYCGVKSNSVLVSVFDGCGGIGSKRYNNYSGKTGAYIASRAVCGGVKSWYESDDENTDTLKGYIKDALNVCEAYADKEGSRFIGSLGKDFPTTAAIIKAKEEGKKLRVTCLWAGDSRCYALNARGLHQLSEDDVSGEDALSNLSNDGVLTNFISASVPFEIRKKEFVVDMPCILFTATDGCFGYLSTPMEFEYLLTNLLMHSGSVSDWKKALYDNIAQFAGDDYSLSAAVFGYGSFKNIQADFDVRNKYVYSTFIASSTDSNTKWNMYKNGYYSI